MAIPLKYATTGQEVLLGPFLDDDDGSTEKTGLTIANTDIKLFKKGGTTLANKASGGATEIANGYYYATLDDTDTNTIGELVIVSRPTDCLPIRVVCIVYPAEVYDYMFATAGTDYMKVDIAQISGTNVSTTSAQLGVNAVNIGGTAQTGRDLGTSVLLSSGTGTGQISLSSGAVTVGTNNDKTGYTASTVSDKTGYSLTQAFPTNFAALDITAGGDVTAATVTDKTGYSLTQSFPTNFASLAITAGGEITVGTNNDKTGYTASTVSDKTGYSISGTKTTLDALNDVSAATVQTECEDAIKAYNLDHLMKTPVADISALGDGGGNEVADSTVLSLMLCKGTDTDTYNHTTDSLESIRDKLPTNLEDMAVTDTTGYVSVGTIANNVITADAINADAITSAKIASGAIDADALAGDAVDEILDEVVEGTLTVRGVLRILLSVLAGKSAGGGTTTITFRDNGDTKNRISATVDASGNRSAVTIDAA